MIYDLPTSLEVCGTVYEIRSDYRAVLDICTALNDIDLNQQERAIVALDIMFVDFENMPVEHYQDALKQCFWFISYGEDETEQQKKKPKLMDWEQDFKHIVAPISRVIGKDVRAMEYLHWWTFLSAYHEIGDCLFSQIVRIRDKRARGKKLEKQEQEWYRQNRELVNFKQRYSEKEKETLKAWGV